ncbi:MAG: creatininase family protein [Gammaproteobacteria bacterium]|jgi:hypothetical protein|nr:creatininase family protein [Gammaproteobacteria bacterium]MDP6535499.1 creatininase family protein [Gammaproteobacteria bacterium]MDP6733172.1 creatininase family protein [Gammaproteobacteria bacterium]|tara:strand:- start:816 stop:1718 length:903 start_codon:yes stop_codon:yes gene_type:complete
MKTILKPLLFLFAFCTLNQVVLAQDYFAADVVSPIAAGDSLWTEELTWIEVRDAVAAGMTTVIIGTGGVEQNGPYLVTGKHNYVLATVMPYIAEEIGNALIAPIVKFVPEGSIDEKSGHMAFPGTISLEQSTFEALLADICRSYAAHGFTDIVLIGDSGGNQRGMANVAEKLNGLWQETGARVHHLGEYYGEDRWSYDFLKSRDITQIDRSPPEGESEDRRTDRRNNMHDDIYYEAQTAVQNPEFIRARQRIDAGLFSLHGVDLSPVTRTLEIGEALARYRAEITARAFRESLNSLRVQL